MKIYKYDLNKLPHFSNLKELVHMRETFANPIAFKYKEKGQIKDISAAAWRQDIEALGTYLFSIGIRNSKVALIGENSYQWILSYFAVVNGGNVIVPIDKELSDEDIVALIVQSGADALIYADAYADVAQSIGHLKLLKMSGFNDYMHNGRNLIRDGNREFLDHEIDDHALCSVIYTSGTTGTPKGVMLSHSNIASDTIGACENVYISGDSMLTLPLHHTFAFTAGVAAMVLYGRTICINASLRTFKEDLTVYRPQNIFVVPLYVDTMYKNIWDTSKRQHKDKLLKRMLTLSRALKKAGIDIRKKLFKSVLEALGGNLDLIVSGGAPIHEKYIEFFYDIGVTVLNGYGITECSPVVAVNRNKCFVTDSVGLILSCNKVRVQDGEVLVKGDNVMLGYYKDEDATAEAFADGWFRTGDLGYVRDDYLFITGRKKNLIILDNGENVSPEELEGRIEDIPGVMEVVVYSERNAITAEIYAQDAGGIQEKIMELNKTLPRYKQIQKVKFRDKEFEKTTTKKIKRTEINQC